MGSDDLPQRIFGLRTVRVLSVRETSRIVLLQQPDGLVARLWSAAADHSVVDRGLVALARAVHPHVMRLLDAETLPDGRPAALHPRVGRGSVLRLLERRDPLSLGEAITLLAPIADAVTSAHDRGVGHGAIDARRILLDSFFSLFYRPNGRGQINKLIIFK